MYHKPSSNLVVNKPSFKMQQVAKKSVYAYFFSINLNDTWENELMVTFEEPNLFEDPFSATWVKIASTILYLLGLITTSVVWSFFSYQMQGKADPYATVINQLVSCNCFFIGFYTTIIVGFDYLRVMVGPLPFWFCIIKVIFKGGFFMYFGMSLATIVIIKFLFLCVWKQMKVMNDDLIARIIILTLFMVSFLLILIKFLGPGKPVLNTIICTGVHLPSYEDLGSRFAPELMVTLFGFLSNVVLMIPISIKRRQNEVFDAQHQPSIQRHNLPKSLESLVWNLVIIVNLLAGIVVLGRLNKTPIQNLNEFPYSFYPFYIQFIGQIQPSIFMCIHIINKHGKNMWKKPKPKHVAVVTDLYKSVVVL